jgi:hypothetical protein
MWRSRYFITEGECEVVVDGVQVAIIGRGEFFGETGAPRQLGQALPLLSRLTAAEGEAAERNGCLPARLACRSAALGRPAQRGRESSGGGRDPLRPGQN